MPQVVNGIGTWYYGKKNLSTRQGVCSQCNQMALLSTYDTRLWFVILFIPIIPLGRKHIMDSCSMCQRHYAANQDEYEMSMQLGISGARDNYDSQPTVENALSLHGSYLGFRQFAEAKSFREEALAEFPQSAELRSVLALQLEQVGDYEAVWPLYQQAFELQPNDPEARIGAARYRMTQNDLDGARTLLDFLEEPGAGQLHSLHALDVLAVYFQEKNRHEEALELWRIVLREYPKVGEEPGFRKAVKKSEKALAVADSMLPHQGFSLGAFLNPKNGRYGSGVRWLFYGGLAALAVLLGMVGLSEYWRTHRELTVINVDPNKLPVSISIDGAPPFSNPTKIPLAEGFHHVKITGAINDEFDISMSLPFFSRLSSDPVWILNIGGAATFEISDVIYAVNPVPPRQRFSAGERFIAVPHVDYLFTEPPQQLKVDSKRGQVVKTAVLRENVPPVRVIGSINTPEDRQRFATTWLTINRDDEELHNAFARAVQNDPAARQAAIKFLEAGLWQEPLSIHWHRSYTNCLREDGQNPDEIAARLYDEKLTATPNHAVLLYLRGRVGKTVRECESFFDRSSTADAKLPWPYIGKAFHHTARGEWADALVLLERAEELGLENDTVVRNKHVTLIALGQTSKLIPRYQGQLMGEFNFDRMTTYAYLCDAFAAAGDFEAAEAATNILRNKLPPQAQSVPTIQALFKNPLSYMFGRWNDFVFVPGQPSEWEAQRLMALGQTKQLIADPQFAPVLSDDFDHLCVSIGLFLEGDLTGATEWRDKACVKWERQGETERLMANLLRGTVKPTDDVLAEVVTVPQQQAAFFAALACFDAEQRAKHLATARKLNATRWPPFHLVKAAVEKLGQ